MLRWIAALFVLSVLTGLLTFGVIPTIAVGLARILFFCFAGMLTFGLVVALLSRA